MGLDSFWHWVILLVIILVIFGTGKLTKIGPDIGNAVRGFKRAMQGEDDDEVKRAEAKRREQEQLKADPPLTGNPTGTGANQAQRDSDESR